MKKRAVRVIFAGIAMVAAANCQISSIVNAASRSGESAAPGSLITILGARLANSTATLSDARTYPTTLGGVSLTVGGRPAGLLYVSPTQVNARIDPTVPLGPAAVVLSSPNGTYNASLNLTVSAPGLFSLNGSGVGDGAIIHAVTYAISAFSPRTGAGPTFLSLYGTGIDVSETPIVRIAGVPVPVLFAGNVQPAGLQQINVQLLDSLAGAGRVSVEVESRGRRSNLVELVLLPIRGQGPFPNDGENEIRSREISGVAWIPNTSLVLVTDENDDVIRVADVVLKRIVRTIVLPTGASPVAVAVNAAGTFAAVAERERSRVAIVNLATNMVVNEVAVGRGPLAVVIAGNTVLVANQLDDTVSAFTLQPSGLATTIPVQRAPRDIAVNAAGTRAYVTNQESGSVSVIDVASRAVVDTIVLGAAVRPWAITLIEAAGMAVVSDPGAGPDGKLLVIDLAAKRILTANANPERTGGVSDLVFSGSAIYGANSAGGSVTFASLIGVGGTIGLSPTIIKVEAGARALAIDAKDNLLVVASQGSGGLTLIDLATNKVVGRVDAVRSRDDDDDDDDDEDNDRRDRERAANMPLVSAVSPSPVKAGSQFVMTITGSRLTGATDVIFIDPESIPGKGHGHGNGNDDYQTNGPFGKRDPGITTRNVVANAAGTQVTALITVGEKHDAGKVVVRVLTPNGESSFVATSGNTLTITK